MVVFNSYFFFTFPDHGDMFVVSETLGCCSVDIVSLDLPSGVPLFLDVPLLAGDMDSRAGETGEEDEGAWSGGGGGDSRGSLQIELLVQRLDH